jgi:cobalt-precorrin 5A hydrolase / precorrin-3B C17-methyltransferase
MTASQRIVVASLTSAGERLAARLPYEHRRRGSGNERGERGGFAEAVRRMWGEVDGLVLICAAGIAVRVIAPCLTDKDRDPAVVCLDDGGRWAIALAGGHRGANTLAREVAGLVGAEPVVTIASDATAGVVALDTMTGFTARGDVAGVTRAWLDGTPPVLDRADLPDWPLPFSLSQLVPSSLPQPAPEGRGGVKRSGAGSPSRARGVVRVSDRVLDAGHGEVVLCPRSLVLGVGASSNADASGVAALVTGALEAAGLETAAVDLVASVDIKAAEPGIVALAEWFAAELRTFPAAALSEEADRKQVPNPSAVVGAAVGTPSVAEAAALLAAGPGATLVVPKQRSTEATVAVARRARPEGHLAVVGLGPGSPEWRTPAAARAVRTAEVVIGYGPYVDYATDLLESHHEVIRSSIGSETERCAEALERAAGGQRVALVCSGDPGVYAMASLVCELAPARGNPPVTIEPGVTAALAAAAVLGAPLGHDHATLSLSDLLTPWSAIERRLTAVAEADLVVSLYNPRSARRTWQLERALEILGKYRSPECPVAVAADVGRPGERVVRTTLGDMGPAMVEDVDMLSLVVVGASTTRWVAGRMVTPRGYAGDAG